MDKLIVDDRGKATISNDGATILKLLDVVHPAAKTLVDIAKSQDAECFELFRPDPVGGLGTSKIKFVFYEWRCLGHGSSPPHSLDPGLLNLRPSAGAAPGLGQPLVSIQAGDEGTESQEGLGGVGG
ncbi:hypothetical protein BTVI_00642 [Pitangus sulphuratus]|nr:hypothetical protein BTVI_00642 [Pitangus sulphuratus]